MLTRQHARVTTPSPPLLAADIKTHSAHVHLHHLQKVQKKTYYLVTR